METRSKYEEVKRDLKSKPKTWLITGVAGFIGSNLLEALLQLDQSVVGVDNFATGHRRNLEDVCDRVTKEQRTRFRLIEGDIRDATVCADAARGIEYILHQAALGSVPRSINDPVTTNSTNINGFLNMIVASRNAGARRFVYAASSSTYGDHEDLPKVEHIIGKPLSPYAVTKYVNELYSDVFARLYGCQTVGLRYFNVFGRRQDPNGAYAAVIPRWISAAIGGRAIEIFGDGETSRDFCYIDNAIQANLLAATAEVPEAINQVYNVAVGEQTTLNQLVDYIRQSLAPFQLASSNLTPIYREPRLGDVRHSLADIGKIRRLLRYAPTHSIKDGLMETSGWYASNHKECLPTEKG